MKDTVQAELQAIGNRNGREPEAIPDDIPIMEIADRLVRGKLKLSQPQMRLLIELLPYHSPKLTAIASSVMDSSSFGALLDRAIERTQRPLKLIEAQPSPTAESPETISSEVMQKPFSRLRRRI
jgi:hypothetical protein